HVRAPTLDDSSIVTQRAGWHGDCYPSSTGGWRRPIAVQRLRRWKGPMSRTKNSLAAAAALLASIVPAFAQDAPAPPAIDSGDTAWMLTSTALVLLMTIPGLALFYGGMVR